MKVAIFAGLLSLAMISPVYAGCGMCGDDKPHDKHDSAEHAAHSGKMCPMHGEKNEVLLEAAKELKKSNPELASELEAMAKNCCGGH